MSSAAPQRQPIATHLLELRGRMLRIVIVLIVGTIIAFAAAPYLFKALQLPYLELLAHYDTGGQSQFLQTLDPAETFRLSMRLAFVLALAILLPYVLFEVWQFVKPGLEKRERRFMVPLLLSSTVLFFGGAWFAFDIVLPFALRFFWDYSLRLGVTPVWTIAKYADFVLGSVLAFGAAFELPVLSTLLALLGVLRASMLVKMRKYAIFASFVLSALLTPADVISMFLMAVPLVILYEISIILVRLVQRRKQPADKSVPPPYDLN